MATIPDYDAARHERIAGPLAENRRRKEAIEAEAREAECNISELADAVNYTLDAAGCPARHRGFLDAILGAAKGEAKRPVEASDLEIASRMRGEAAEGKAFATLKQYVRRARLEFFQWQDEHAPGLFLHHTPGRKDLNTGRLFKSRYTVPLLGLAARVRAEATEHVAWDTNRPRALRETARRIMGPLVAELPKPTPEGRAAMARMRAEKDAARILASIGRSVDQLCRVERKASGSAVEVLTTLREQLDAAIADEAARLALAPLCPPSEWPSADVDVRNTQKHLQSEASAEAPQLPPEAAPYTYTDVGVGEPSEAASKGYISVALCEAESEAPEPPEAEAARALDAFTSVGAEAFEVTVKDDANRIGREHGTFDAAELRAELAPLLDYQGHSGESIIVRLRGGQLVQIDDAPEGVRDHLEPLAFATVETSPGSYQVWLALDGPESPEAMRAVRDRLLAALADTGANGGAYGALRWPGTENRKPERRGPDGSYPRVRLVSAAPGRTVTVAQLDAAGLLAPEPEPRRSDASRVIPAPWQRAAAPAPRSWPSYERALADAPLKADGTPDRSRADFMWALLAFGRGRGYLEVCRELLEVSARARQSGAAYVERTVAAAARSAGAACN